jgi:hypothetical protein
VIPWAVAAAGVTAAAGLAGSALQSQAAGSAADKANAAQERALAQSRADLEPWRTTGGTANTATVNAAGLGGQQGYDDAMTAFHASPGYAWQLDQGLRAVDAGAAAKGMLRSGATLKAEQAYGAGLADKEFTDYYNRLFDLSKLGETAAAGSATASQNTGTSMAQTDLSAGSAQSSIYGNAAKGIGDAATNYANNRLYDERFASIYGGPGGGYGVDYSKGA